MRDLNEEKICLQISRRVKGGHPPFIGDGRTGENPAFLIFLSLKLKARISRAFSLLNF